MHHINGKNKGNIMLYALSTCVWCKKTKKLLNEIGVEYSYEDVDVMTDEERDKIAPELSKWCSDGFPAIVIDDKDCIHGYNEEEIRKVLG